MSSITKKGLLYIVRKKLSKKRKQVPPELQQAIDECTTIQELLDLLFSTGFKDEYIIDAFDKKLEELDPPF